MKTLRHILIVAAALGAAFLNPVRASVAAGSPAPDFALKDLDGQTRRLSDFKGRTVVLEWVNSGCPIVKKHYESGNMPRLQKAATADGVVWLSINTGADGVQGATDAPTTRAWLAKEGAAPTAYLRDPDGSVGRLYGAKTTPHMFVINADGVLVYNGAMDSIRSAEQADIAKATNYVTVALADVKAGRPVEKATTQPYGCAVKY